MTEHHSTRVARHGVNPGRPRTPRFDIEHLKTSIDLADLVRSMSDGEGQPSGGNYWFRCPMPDHEDRDPSFSVRKDGPGWRCWSCHENGSGPIDLVMAVHRLDFGPAVRWLGERYGGREATDTPSMLNRKAPPRPPTPTDPENLDRREAYHKAKRLPFERGTQFRSQLVRDRKWSDDPGPRNSVVDRFGIELVELNRKDKLTDKWRTEVRYRFPFIYRGRVSAWQDRAAGPYVDAKWLTSPGGLEVPYNVDRLAGDASTIVICEGPADVVTFDELRGTFTPGTFPIVLGFPGASMTKRRWLDALRDDGRPVIVLADNDDAGEAMRRKFVDELGDQVVTTVRVPDDHADFGDWWTAVGHDDLEERGRFVKQIETEGDRHGNP